MNTNKKLIKSKILSVFDFDGTLTRRDSFIPFLYFAFGRCYFIKHATLMLLPTLYYINKRSTRDELKKALIKSFLKNIDEYWLCQKAEDFCKKYWTKLMRPSSLLSVNKEITSGAEVTICSASPTLVLQPFANKLGIKLIGTQLQVKNGKLTGDIVGYNCRCAQKVERLKQIYGDLDNYYLRAWGDSCGDHELLSIAQDPHWQYSHSICVFHNYLRLR